MTDKEETLSLGQVELDNRWNWISMIDRLSDGDISKHDNIYERNYIECLNLLSYWHEKDIYTNKKNNIKNNYRNG